MVVFTCFYEVKQASWRVLDVWKCFFLMSLKFVFLGRGEVFCLFGRTIEYQDREEGTFVGKGVTHGGFICFVKDFMVFHFVFCSTFGHSIQWSKVVLGKSHDDEISWCCRVDS